MSEVEIGDDGRPYAPWDADEATMLRTCLDYHRATLALKCRGLDAEALRGCVAPSSLTLGGLMKHMTHAEQLWFYRVMRNAEYDEPWASIDWKVTPDWAFDSAAGDDPELIRAAWESEIERSRATVDEFLARGGLSQQAAREFSDGYPTVRWILVHMIEEYARHNGHADLLREAIDGERGM